MDSIKQENKAKWFLRTLGKSGFTIVEFMVATTVFSVILIIVTTGIMNISETYRRGINLADTQTAARNIIDSVSQSIQFSGGNISWPDESVTSGVGCIGNQEFNFRLGQKLMPKGPDGTNDWQSTSALSVNPNKSNCSAADLSPPASDSAIEMLSPRMRLNQLSIKPVAAANNLDRMFEVKVTVIYGDYDLLCESTYAESGRGGCGQRADPIDPTGSNFHSFLLSPNLKCRNATGSAYCAIARLSRIVQQRLTAGQL